MGFLADPAPVDRAPAVRLADDANPLAGMPFLRQPHVGGYGALRSMPIRPALS